LILYTGEVGKLLGAKWKELDDEEKKVGDAHRRTHVLFTNQFCSPMLSVLRKISPEQKRKRPHMRWAIHDAIGLSRPFLLRPRVTLRREVLRPPKEAVKTKTKMKTNFLFIGCSINSRLPFWTRLL